MVMNDYSGYIEAAREQARREYEAMAKEKAEYDRLMRVYSPTVLPGGPIKISTPTPGYYTARAHGISYDKLLALQMVMKGKYGIDITDDDQFQEVIDAL